ncbi:MAG TPA: PhoH family protein [Candidatus Avacidaminococcus intestinavium]|uniref:PhoH family protein n=1 Tax=Candidatus Avacidaminococcus intestinavium TaxID=2840684 RepID=A0A9D1MPE1_9FIRM|nr:PhoH family protein [Candidatus Avacidaminococcus intestinavium]
MKHYVLDTNVLLHSPNAFTLFSEHYVILPEVVLEEIDRFKTEASERGANSRQVSRLVDALLAKGNLLEGIVVNAEGGLLKVETNHTETRMPPHLDLTKADNRILQVCKGLQEERHDVVLVSRDTNLRVKASILQIQAEDFRNDKVSAVDEQYTGRAVVYCASTVIDEFHDEEYQTIEASALQSFDAVHNILEPAVLSTNQFVLIKSTDKERHTALGRFDGEKIVHLKYYKHNPFGIVPRNVGQIFMQECLMMSAQEAPLVILKGPAGTAKTFYALGTGLHKIMECRSLEYHHLLLCRPNVPMDEDIGFLPGSEAEKISPFMRGVRDNLFVLMNSNGCEEMKELAQIEDSVQMLFDNRIIQTEALAYQRGRSLQKYWMILDEMQNSTPRQAKGVITRPGLGTKIVIIGDPAQIDHPYLDSRSNGLVYASERMRGSKLCFQVTLQNDECERSPLAAEAARLL